MQNTQEAFLERANRVKYRFVGWHFMCIAWGAARWTIFVNQKNWPPWVIKCDINFLMIATWWSGNCEACIKPLESKNINFVINFIYLLFYIVVTSSILVSFMRVSSSYWHYYFFCHVISTHNISYAWNFADNSFNARQIFQGTFLQNIVWTMWLSIIFNKQAFWKWKLVENI